MSPSKKNVFTDEFKFKYEYLVVYMCMYNFSDAPNFTFTSHQNSVFVKNMRASMNA